MAKLLQLGPDSLKKFGLMSIHSCLRTSKTSGSDASSYSFTLVCEKESSHLCSAASSNYLNKLC